MERRAGNTKKDLPSAEKVIRNQRVGCLAMNFLELAYILLILCKKSSHSNS